MNKLVSQLCRAAASRLLPHGARVASARPASASTGARAPESLPFRRKALFEALEPRVLLSADLLPAVVVADAASPTVTLTPQAGEVMLALTMSPVGPIEGGVRVAEPQSGSFAAAESPAEGASFSYSLEAAAGQLISVAASAVDPSATAEVLTALELRDPDGLLIAQGSGTSQAALQAVTANLSGTYSVLLRAQALPIDGGGTPAVTVDWRIDAALDALLEGEAFQPLGAGNNSLETAELLQQARALPLPDAARTAVVGRLTPGSNDGRTDSDHYSISLAAGETLEVGTSLRSPQGFLLLLDDAGQLVAASQRTGENMDWNGPIGLPLFRSDEGGDYVLKLELWWDSNRPLDPIDYTLLVARNTSLDPDSGDELGLGASQLGAIVNPIVPTGSELAPLAAAPMATAVYGATVTAETVIIDLLPLAEAAGGGVTAPVLALFDGDGSPVAWVEVAPPAGQGGHRYTASAAVGSRLWIEVSSATDGQFLLQVQGAAGDNPVPMVPESTLDDGLAGSASPWQWMRLSETFRADLAGALQLFDAGGELVNQLPVYPWYNDTGLGFNLPDGLPAGTYTLVAPAGAFVDLTGQPSERFERTFTVDDQRPQLVSSTPANGAELGIGQTITLQFNEPMATYYWPEATFRDSNGQVLDLNWWYDWSPDGTALTITLSDTLAEGLYEMSLPPWALRDRAENEFDADPSAEGLQALTVQFSVDQLSYVLPALFAREPLGSLVYATGRDALLSSWDDIDEFSFELSEGQVFSAVLSPVSGQAAATLPQLNLTVIDPDGNEVAAGATTQGGRALLLPDLYAGSGGTWRLRVQSGAGETGAYSAAVVLGAAVQREFVEIYGEQQPSNGSRETAEDLDSTSLALAAGIDRLASVGRFSPGFNADTGQPISDVDFFRFTLEAGQTASIIVAIEGTPFVSNLRMALFDDSGDWATSVGTLVAAADVAPGADRVILDYTNDSDQAMTLFARPRADTSVRYSIIVTRGATFDIGLLDGQPQALGPSGAVLGYVGDVPGSTGGFTPAAVVNPNLELTDGQGYRWDFNSYGSVNDGTDNAFDGAPYLHYQVAGISSDYLYANTATVDASGREITVEREVVPGLVISRSAYVPADDGFARFFESVRNDTAEAHTVTLTLYAWMGSSDGAAVVVNSDSGAYDVFETDDHWLVTDDSEAYGSPSVAHVSWGEGGRAPDQGSYSGSQLMRSWTVVVAPGETASVMHFVAQAGSRDAARSIAERLAGLPTEAIVGLSRAELNSVVNFRGDLPDSYRVWVNEGDDLQLALNIAGAEQLPLRLRLFAPDGSLRFDTGAADGPLDGLGTGLIADLSGAWLVQVMSAGAPGEYLLQVQGATGQAPAPQLVAANPADGQPTAGVPAWIDLSFDQFIRSDSVGIDDLVFDAAATAAGVAVTSVEVRSGRSFRFHLAGAEMPEGPVGWSIAQAALISHDGQGNVAAAGSFVVDHTAPHVTGHSPTSVLQLSSLSFDFSEAIDATTVGLDDVLAFTDPLGSDIRGSITGIAAAGNQVTVTLATQYLLGDYTLTLGPDIRDLAGNRLDQDGDGSPGEAGDDTYTATVTVASVDLVVESIALPDSLLAGAVVEIGWTVRNNGNLRVPAGTGGWYDRVYLLAADNGASWYLGDAFHSNATALNPGDGYATTATFTVPLTSGVSAGDYRIQIYADIYNYQPEQNNGNNSLASNMVPLSLPDLADVLPSVPSVPGDVSAGSSFDITWTTTNQGPGDASNGFYDRVELVDLYGNLVETYEEYYVEGYYTDGYYDEEGNYHEGYWVEGHYDYYYYPAFQQDFYIGPLTSGASTETTTTVNLPNALPQGQYQLRITSDVYNYLFEDTGESNNVVLSDVISVGLIDLQPQSVTAPISVTMGEQITIDWTVENVGASSSYDYYGYWYDQVQLVDADTGAVAFTTDVQHYRYEPLGAGQTYAGSATFTVPVIAALTGGDYLVRVVVDAYGYRTESDETNNVLDAVQPLTIIVPTVPDLAISNITVPASVAGNTDISIGWTITNQGEADTNSVFYDRFWLVATNGVATYLGEAYQGGNLAAAGELTRTQTFLVPYTLAPGSYQVRIATDHYGYLSELQGEDNNLALSESLEVTTAIIADLQIQDIASPAGITLGQPVTVSWTGVNNGTGSTSASGWYDRVELVNAGGSVVYTQYAWISPPAAVPAGGTYDGSLTFTPAISASYPEGSYRFRVTADGYYYYNQIESNESNNALTDTDLVSLVAPPTPDLRVTSVAVPASAPANTRITVTWNDTNSGDAASTAAYYTRVEVLSAGGSRWYDAIPLFPATEIAAGASVARSHELLLPVGMPPGSYTVRISTDYYGYVAEYDQENNNTATSTAFTVTEALRADLGNVRFDPALPASALLGSTLTVNYSVDNLGVGSTQNVTWTDRVRVVLASDPSVVLATTNVSAGNSSTGVPAGGSYSRQVSLALPLSGNFAPGDYLVQVQTDVNANLNEADRSNNNLSGPLALQLPLLANLVVRDVVVPEALNAGSTVNVSWTTANTGTGDLFQRYGGVNYFHDRVYLADSSGNTLRELGDFIVNGPFAPGTELARVQQVTLPDDIVDGSYRIVVVTDVNDYINEHSGESDNRGTSGLVTITQPPRVDLQAASLGLPAEAFAGSPLVLTWRTSNAGEVDFAGAFNEKVQISSSATFATDVRDLLPVSRFTGTIAAGSGVDRTAEVLLPVDLNGPSTVSRIWYLRVLTDSSNEVYEYALENNNASAGSALLVTRPNLPDLQVDSVDAPDAAVAGTEVVVTYTVTNHGSLVAGARTDRIYLLAEDGPLSTLTLYQPVNEPLAAGASQTLEARFTLPVNIGNNGFYGRLRAQVTTDYSDYYHPDQVEEYPNDDNNTRSETQQTLVTLPPLSNLRVTDISAPLDALTEDEVPVRWTITNAGAAATGGGWTDRLWLSSDGVLGSDRHLGDFSIDTSLAAGASIERVQNIALPRDLTGPYRLIVVTDLSGNLYEGPTGEGADNVTVDDQTLMLLQRPLPNLVVTSVTPPANAFSGQAATVGWTVKNTGNTATTVPVWHDAVYLSLDDVLDGADTYLGTSDNPGYLEADGSYANSLTATLPRGIDANYRFLVVTDVYNQMFEGAAGSSGETDNIRNSEFARVTLTPPPDLVVTAVNAPPQAFSGQPVTLSWEVANDGEGHTLTTSWIDRVWLSTDTTLGNGDVHLGDVHHSGGLDVEESYAGSLLAALPIGLTGNFHIIVTTDIGNSVYEHTSEANNSRARETAMEIVLTPPPDLEVVSTSFADRARAGTTFTLNYRVENLGASATPAQQSWWYDYAWLSLDDNIDANDIALGSFQHYGTLDTDAGYGVINAQLGSQLQGNYRVLLRTDAGNGVFEDAAGEANNLTVAGTVELYLSRPDLQVTAFTMPAAVEAGRTAAFSWTVGNLGSGDSITAGWSDSLWVSLDDDLGDSDDVLIGNVGHAGVLAPGASYTVNVAPVLPFALSGSGRFYLRTDGGNEVVESNDANNLSAVIRRDITRREPDLVVSDAVVTPVDGDARSFDLRFTVQNNGIAATNVNAWNDGIWLSGDDFIGAGDTRARVVYRGNPLAAGDSYTVQVRVSVPDGVPAGNFKVLVRADDDNTVIEGAGESNNVAVASVTLGGVPVPGGELPVGEVDTRRPDLTIVAVDAPDAAFSGQQITVRWTSRNQGPDDAANPYWWSSAYDQVFLSSDLFLDSGDLSLGYVGHSGQAAGSDVERSLTTQLPVGRSGLYYVLVKADAGNRFAEPDAENNNIGFDPSLLSIALSPPADLLAGSISLPATASPGLGMDITYTVSNISSNSALGSWRDALYLSQDDVFDTGDVYFGALDVYGPVAGGGSYTRTVHGTVPGVDPGDYKLIVRSDVRNVLVEASEANNLSASVDAVALDVPSLTLGVAATGSFAGAQSLFFKVSVGAGEALRFTLDGPGEDVAHDMFVSFDAVPSRSRNDLGTGEQFTPDPRLTVPTTEAGVYYVRIDSSPFAVGAFSLRADLVPFSVEAVSKSTLGNTGEATVRIDGARFDADTRFELVAADGTAYRSVAVHLRDAGRAYVTFDLFDAATGAYDLRALDTTAGGAELVSTLADAVTVIDGIGADAFLTISGPTAVQVNRNASFTLNYSNDGDADTLAPLIIVTPSNGTTVGLSAAALSGAPLFILGTSLDGPADLLRPGARYSLPVAYKTPGEAGFLSIEARPVQADSTEAVLDWSAIERSVRPAGVDFAAWQAFWGRVQPAIGSTMGDLVQVLNEMVARLSPTGDPIRDVRALFAAQLAADPNWKPTQQVTGRLLSAGDASPVAGAQVQLVSAHGDGWRVVGSAVTDADGRFAMSRVKAGTYAWATSSGQFDQDRNGEVDEVLNLVSVAANAPLDAGTLYLATSLADAPVVREDSDPTLLVDSQGVAHMFWRRGDLFYHAWQDASGQWTDARPISDAVGANLVAAADPALIDGMPGLIAVWEQGTGNETQLWIAVGIAVDGGGYMWSTPQQITDEDVGSYSPSVAIDNDGKAVITFQRRDFDQNDDADLYHAVIDVDPNALVWTNAAGIGYAMAEALGITPADLETLGTQKYSAGYPSKEFGPFTLGEFSFRAGWEGTISSQLDDEACTVTDSLTGKGSLMLRVPEVGRINFEGSLSGSGNWIVDPNTQDWKFTGAQLDAAASGQLEIKDGIFKVLALAPPLAPVATGLRKAIAKVSEYSGGAVRLENSVLLGPVGFEAKDLRWSLAAPFPSFIWPESVGEFSIGAEFGLQAKAVVKSWDAELSLQGKVGLKARIYPTTKVDLTYSASLTGKVAGWGLLSGEWAGSTNLYGSSLEVLAADADGLIFSVDPTAALGTTNVYGAGAIDDGVGSNRVTDSPMELARGTDGRIWGLFARDSDADSGVGNRLYATSFAGGMWSDEVAIADTLGFNLQGELAVLGDGARLAVWSHASSAGLSEASTFDDLMAARQQSDLYFAIDTGSGFSPSSRFFDAAGSDSDIALAQGADGSVAVAWVHADAGERVLYTARWTGSGFGPATEVARTSGTFFKVTIALAGDRTLLAWNLDDTPDNESDATLLQTASISAGGSTTLAEFESSSLAEAFDKVIAAPQQAAAGLMNAGMAPAAGWPVFAVPEDCKKCTPEKLKKISEAAPDCRPGGGSTTTLDSKKCEEKTITYAPCVTRPSDPNDIIGPDGYGEQRWTKASEALAYTIRFENQASATAPAQVVTITQTLDADLDARSFRVTEFGFADLRVSPDQSRSYYSGRLDLRDSQGIYLDVSALIDVASRQITWTFTSIDPETGEVPVDSNLGFLLPNDDSGRGDGFVSYTVKPLRTAATGDVIDAQARIVFDSEGPIDTPPIFNTLDTGTPSSRVEALPATSDSATFTVRWSGTDAEGGSALRDYEVYVSIDGGDFVLWQLATTDTEAVYDGEAGHRYAFYSVARDNAGNIEAAPTAADTETRVPAQTGSVAGLVFNDIDFDGTQDEGEAALAGWTVFVDADANGALDDGEASVVTGDDGRWSFAELQPDTWRVVIEQRGGHEVTTPVVGYFDVTVAAGDALTGRDFGVLQLGSIGGVQFDDLNGNGQRDDGEAGLAGWTVFIDGDDDGQLDDGERHTVTAGDGSYVFDNLRPGQYQIGQVAQDGWIQTRPGLAGASGTTNNSTAFAVTLSGSLASISLPACACGGTITTVAAQQAGWDEQLVELDALRADPGHAGVDGSGVRVVVIDTGIDPTHPFFDGRIVYQYDFADNDTQAIDRNGHGTHVAGVIAGADAMFGGVAPGAELIVLKVFGDDGSGSFRSLERALQWVLSNADAYNIGVVNLSLGDGGNWADAGSRYGLGDEFAALAAMNIINVAAAGNSYATANALGVSYPGSDPAVLAIGAVWAGDFGGPWKFGNGGIDEATGADHIASFSQRDPDQTDVFAPGARLTSAAPGGGVRTMQGTSQSAAYVSGVAALAQQMAREHLGRSLSVAEFRDLLVSTAVSINDGDDERDNVANSGLDFPRLDVKRLADAIIAMAGGVLPGDGTDEPGGGVLPGDGTDEPGDGAGPTPIDPATGAGNLVIDLAQGQQVADADFGVFKLGSVSGLVFDDRNGDGQHDAGEAGIAGAMLFVDADGNGLLDDGETTISTDADGHWQLDNLLPGSLRVVETLPAGWARTGPADGVHSLTVTSGLVAGTLDFGRQDIAPEAVDDQFSTEQGQSVSGNVLANDSDPGRPDKSRLVVSVVSEPAHGTLTLDPDGAFVYQPADGYEGPDSFRYAVSDGVSEREATVSINVTHQMLQVARLDGRHDGFEVAFSRAIAQSGLEVGGAAADLVVTGPAGQAVAGSLFVAADGRSARFLASGGPLADGTYSVRLVAGAEALRDLQGVALDGDGDGSDGDDHLGSFTLARGNAVTVGLADTARGPGQLLGVALGDSGLAVRLSQGSGVTSVSFTLAYDPALLGLATVARGTDLPASASFSATELAPGQIAVQITSASGLPAGALTLARLVATVPSTATYGAAQVLDLRDLLVNGGAIAALDDDAVHVAAFPGDLNRDQQLTGADVALMRDLLGGTIARLPGWPLIDGRLLGDVNGSGRFDAVDPLRLEQTLAGASGLTLPVPGATPPPPAPPPVVVVAPVVRTVVPKVVPRLAAPAPSWVAPLVSSSATISANVNIRVSL